MKITVIGAGKVGLPLACHLADLDHDVTVFDKNEKLLEQLRQQENPLPWEEDINPGLLRVAPNLIASTVGSDVFFIVTPTPQIGPVLSSGPVVEVLAALEQCLSRAITVAIVSTLDPRDAAAVCADRRHMKIVYNPPLIRLGNVKQDLRNATMTFLGRDGDPEPIGIVKNCYQHKEFRAKPIIGNVVSIATAKLAINATLASRAAWGNDVANKARTLGAHVPTVFEAFAAEPRIGGTAYMMPGPPPAGPCLPRDMDTWCSIGNTPLAPLINQINDNGLQQITTKAVAWVGTQLATRPGMTGTPLEISIIGVGYKRGGPDITKSVGATIAKNLHANFGKNVYLRAYDPACAHLAAQVLPFLRMEPIAEDAAKCDAAIICQDYELVQKRLIERQIPILAVNYQGR